MEQKKKKRLSTPIILFIVLMAVTAGLCATAFGLWYSGRQTLTAQVVAPKLPTPVTEEAEAVPEAEAPEPAELLETYTLRYNGKEYQYNENIVNILLLGIDADNKPAEPLPYGSDIQVDVLLLAALDLENNKMSLLSINRDTMCQIEVVDEAGETVGYARSQVALSFSYGDGLEESCEKAVQAVSDLFYGLQIHGYGAFYMGGVASLNDALGGVTVTILDDYPFTARGDIYSSMVAGTTMKLTGKQAYAYIRSRTETEDGNTGRMQRQKQYMLAMLSQALNQVKENPGCIMGLYNSVADYLLTDLNLSRIMYLATCAASMDFSGDIRSLQGDLVLGEGSHMELILDETALYELMLDVFYQEIG